MGVPDNMTRWRSSIPLAVLCWPALATAQSTGFQGPISGFVYNHDSRSVRPLLGVPGATHIGSPLLADVDFASTAPGSDSAFVIRAGRSIFMRGVAGPQPVEYPIDGLLAAVDRVVWTPDGSAALLYSSSTNQLQRVRLSNTAPAADPPLDLSPWGPPAALAIDPAGRQIAFGVPQSGIYLFSAGQSPALLSPAAQPAAAAFDSNGQNLYVIDLDQQQILKIESGSVSVLASVAQPDGSAASPVGLAVSGDGRYVFFADNAAKAIRVYETSSGNLAATLPLDFTPTRFEALSAAPTILLNGDNPTEWLLVVDARQLPGLFFVPALPEAAQ